MAFEVVCPTCAEEVSVPNNRGGSVIRCPACQASMELPEKPQRRRNIRDDDAEKPRRKHRKSKSNSKVLWTLGLTLGGLCLLCGIGGVVGFLVGGNGGGFGSREYPNLTPEKFNSAVKIGMSEQEAIDALGPPTRRQPVVEKIRIGNGWSNPRKTSRIRLTWVIQEELRSWKSCWAELEHDGGKICSTGHGSGFSK